MKSLQVYLRSNEGPCIRGLNEGSNEGPCIRGLNEGSNEGPCIRGLNGVIAPFGAPVSHCSSLVGEVRREERPDLGSYS